MKIPKIYQKIIGHALLTIFMVIILGSSIRGLAGNPSPAAFNSMPWKDNGPLELSPERGRYALLYALAEYKTVTFPADLARFAAPDVGYINGHYVSLFAPTVSFIAVLGYWLGQYFGLAQVGSFATIGLFALVNVFLLRSIAIRLGANHMAATIGAITFLFASPAFSYAVTLYQHHISTFLILSSLYLLMRFNTLWSLLIIWMLFAFSISVDYPNLFMMLPISVVAFIRAFMINRREQEIDVRVSVPRILAIGATIVPLIFFMWFNNASYGNPFKLSGAVERAVEVKKDGSPLMESEAMKQQMKEQKEEIVVAEKTFFDFFQPRNLMVGSYTHFFSPDRGMIMYTPVMFLGIAGIIIAWRKKLRYFGLLLSIIGFNILLYSMWGDPYGGWAFGSRYLIPTYAILGIFIAIALTKLYKYNLALLFFFIVFGYSVGVNTLGAITSNANPPKIEAEALAHASGVSQQYTYLRNVGLLDINSTKTFFYQTYAHHYVTAWQYYSYLVVLIMVTTGFLLMYLKADAIQKEKAAAKTANLIHPILGRKRQQRFLEIPIVVKGAL